MSEITKEERERRKKLGDELFKDWLALNEILTRLMDEFEDEKRKEKVKRSLRLIKG